MFTYSHVRQGPTGQPVMYEYPSKQGLCNCSCHHPGKPPPAVEARLCRECADERFQSWQALVNVLVRDD